MMVLLHEVLARLRSCVKFNVEVDSPYLRYVPAAGEDESKRSNYSGKIEPLHALPDVGQNGVHIGHFIVVVGQTNVKEGRCDPQG